MGRWAYCIDAPDLLERPDVLIVRPILVMECGPTPAL